MTLATAPPFEARVVELRLHHPWTIARGTATTKRNVVVALARDGHVGRGEAAPNARFDESSETVLLALAGLEAAIVGSHGRDLRGGPRGDLARFHADLSDAFATVPRSYAAKAAVDIALHDHAAKALGLPLHVMLGVDPSRMPVTSFSIGIAEPARIADRVREAAPYAVLKVKLGSPRDDDALFLAVRGATDKPVRVDANEGWRDKEEALARIVRFASAGVELVEQPLPAADLEGARWLAERSPIPIVADEAVGIASDIPRLQGAYHAINVKLSKCGGIAEALRMVGVARAHGMKVMLGCMIESSLGIGAAAQIAPLFDWVDLDGNLLIDDDPFRGHPIVDGRIRLLAAPGVGAEPQA